MERPYKVLVVTMWFINLKSTVREWNYFRLNNNYTSYSIPQRGCEKYPRKREQETEVISVIS